MQHAYRLGIDLGTNSIGWAAVKLNDRLEPGPMLDMGVRIFSDARNPKDKSSNAAQRREPRSLRRNRDRRLQRKQRFMNALVAQGLMPVEREGRKRLEAVDPWILRAKALHQQLTPFEIGRALFHLQQRRGFKSNRKTDAGDSEAGKVYSGIAASKERLRASGKDSLGDYFGSLRLAQEEANSKLDQGQRLPMPQSRVRTTGQGSNAAYDYYPQREMILDEFDLIWESQKHYHPDLLSPSAHEKLRGILAWQRPLKAQPKGKCTLLPGCPRAAKAMASSQFVRIAQEVNNLTVGVVGESKRPLSPEERSIVAEALLKPTAKSARKSFDQIRKLLKLPASVKFNLESEKRTFLEGDVTAARMMQTTAWGQDWFELSIEKQDLIVENLLETEDETQLVGWLESEFNLSGETALNVSRVRLPDGYGKLSTKANTRLAPELSKGLLYDQAVNAAGMGDHSQRGDGVVHEDHLPYYGEVLNRHTALEKANPKNDEERFGRVANPTVHVALNELRKVVNDLIRRYGPPTQVVLEMARELPMSDRGLNDLERDQRLNQHANEQRREQLASLSVSDTHENRLKLRLFEELDPLRKACVFTGQPISLSTLFSDEIEIEHLLPFSRTLDDSFANKVLSLRQANREKGNRTPFEAFNSSAGYDWEAITQRAEVLPSNKRWRFNPDAMEKFEADSDFLPRMLNDTRYITSLGKSYIEGLFGGQGSPGQTNSVWVVNGRLTADLRHFSGFNGILSDSNRKDRSDHRHHAIDALVVALTDRSMIKRVADLAKLDDKPRYSEVMNELAEPLKRYFKPVSDWRDKMTVSHKPDHGFQAGMHNDTAFGLTGETDSKGQPILVTRKPLSSFANPKDLLSIRDPDLRDELYAASEGLSGADFVNAVVTTGLQMHPQVKSARVITPMKSTSFVTISNGKDGVKAYKGDSNYCYDIWVDQKGKWTGNVVTTFEAYQRAQTDPDWWRRPTLENGTKLIMRLRKGDMLELDGPSGRRKVIVFKFTTGKIDMAEHYQANASARVRANHLEAIRMAPSALQRASAVVLHVSPSGRVKKAY
ncbi:type II CRISPR RNA-guided endonuclease Cas9 [Ponticaulis sp.]|uniref:type II CRISPR RNA-guided endonuclease Cas9 n=1 Tax=Ponticaulis sp. TaxID=2020902 RepID=UPI0025E5CA96|nr:type II CRISPR RNA-guided endonuclease Cas9 [Ponticaulis sp.]